MQETGGLGTQGHTDKVDRGQETRGQETGRQLTDGLVEQEDRVGKETGEHGTGGQET